MTKRLQTTLPALLALTFGLSGRQGVAQTELESIPSQARQAEQDSRHPSESGRKFDFLNALVEQALRVNPEIQAARKGWQAAEKRPSQVSSLPNPELTFGSMSGGSPLPFSTLGDGPLSWASFMFSQKIPWPGKLDLKGEISSTEAEQEAWHYRATTLQAIRRLKETYFELHAAERTLQILDRYRGLLAQFSQMTEVRYSVGEGNQQEVLRAQVEISLLEERIELVRTQAETARSRINSLLNRSPDAGLDALPVIDGVEIEIPFSLQEMYLRARNRNPSIEVERLEIKKAGLELDLSRKARLPDMNVSAGWFLRDGPFNNMYQYQFGLELPLYFWRKERLGVEEQVESLQQSRHSYRQRLQEVTYDIKDAYLSARTSEKLLSLYRRGIIPQATASLDAALATYQVGKIDFPSLVADAITILTYELQYQQELKNYFQNLTRIEELLSYVLVR